MTKTAKTNYQWERALENLARKKPDDMRGMEDALAPGVAPMEAISCPPFVASTKLRFGFDYLNYVKKELEQKIDDEVLMELDDEVLKDIEEEVGEELLDYDTEGDTDVDTSASVTDDAAVSHPFDLDISIPEEVGLDTLHMLASQFDDAADYDYDDDGQDDMSIHTHSSTGLTLHECATQAHQMGEESGFDMGALYNDGGGTTLPQHDANASRNVALRQRQSQSASSAVSPDFNADMKEKWIEIWGKSANPSDGRVSLREWIKKSITDYRVWMYRKQIVAGDDGLAPPCLYNVDYDSVKAWVEKMKTVGSRAAAEGAFDRTSLQLSESFDLHINSTEHSTHVAPFSQEGGIGIARSTSEFELSARSGDVEEVNDFPPPTTSDVSKNMPPKPSKKRQKTVDYELKARQEAARKKLDEANIPVDQKDKKKKRCNVCFKYYDSFIFEEVKHLRNSNFCPVIDDRAIYDKLVEDRKGKRKQTEKKSKMKRRGGGK